jgi:AcrR family transcriptional regulator
MKNINNLADRIIYSALNIFISRGIKKTSIDEIAKNAGITRITAYRYFDNKKELVRASFLSVVAIFENVGKEIKIEKNINFEDVLDRIKTGLAQLPQGNLMVLMEELKIIYPDIYEEVNERRIAAITNTFRSYFSSKKQISQLRNDLNPLFLQAFIEHFVLNIINTPAFTSLDLTQDEIFNNIKKIILHGILKK